MEAEPTPSASPEGKDLYIQHVEGFDNQAMQWVQTKLRHFNTQVPGGNDFKHLHLFVRDTGGNLQGGLLGWTLWSWMHIDALWVEPDLRGRGVGARLLAEAERLAALRGCTLAEVDTFNYQAPDFYQRRGYEIFGKLENIGGRFTRYYLKKILVAVEPAAEVGGGESDGAVLPQ